MPRALRENQRYKTLVEKDSKARGGGLIDFVFLLHAWREVSVDTRMM